MGRALGGRVDPANADQAKAWDGGEGAASGFADIGIDGGAENMWFGHDADDAHRFVLGLMGWMLEALDDAARAQAVEHLRATLAAHVTADGVVYGSATWTVHACRA
jgi:hypothetical protein